MSAPAPGSPEWTRLITASKVGAILGVSPFDSPRSIWHLMRGDVAGFAGNDATRRGHYLEDGVLAWWRDRYDIGHDEGREYQLQPYYTLGNWAAATPDMVACHPVHDNVLVDAKTTTMDDEWGLPGSDEVPTNYYAQALWAMHVSGVHRFHFAVLHSRLRFEEYVVPYDADQGRVLETKMREFYDSLASDIPPPLDDTVATFDTMRRVHTKIERGVEVEVDQEAARRLVEWCDELKATEKSVRLAKSTVMELMGQAQYATHNGVRIARRQPRGEDVTFVVTAKPADLPETEGIAS